MGWFFNKKNEKEATTENASDPLARTVNERSGRPAAEGSIEETEEALRARELELAIDTVGGLVRTFSELAFDTDDIAAKDIQDTGEKWAKHVLLRTAAPDSEGNTKRRDWAGVRRFFTNHRKVESQYVTAALSDLRSVVNAFVQTMGRVVMGDGDSDTQVIGQLERLRVAAQGNSIETLKREALSVADAVTSVISEKRKRQRQEMAELGEKISTLGNELDEARKASNHDPLTQLLNRGAFDDVLARTSNLCNVFGHHACLLMVDADHFKSVNDTHGHPGGDAVLRAIADSMTRTFLRKGDFVCRYGGEEFAVILRETTDKDAPRLAERARESIGKLEIPFNGKTLKVTVSIGAALAYPGETAQAWLARADKAVYAAKANGRNCVVVAESPGPAITPVGAPLTAAAPAVKK